MQFRLLSIEAMIALCKYWLTNIKVLAILNSHELGMAMRKQIVRAHQALRAVHLRRSEAKAELRRLKSRLTELSKRHNAKARALRNMLLGLQEGTEDPALAALCQQLLTLCFPDDLRLINWSYVDQGGYADAMVEKLSPDLRARMAPVMVGEQSLLDLCDAWLHAGQQLGHHTLERAQLEASIASSSPSPSAVSVKRTIALWTRTVRALLENMELMELSESQRESLLAPLQKSLVQATSSRTGNSDGPATYADAPIDEPGDLVDQDHEPSASPEDENQPDAALDASGRLDGRARLTSHPSAK